MIKILHTADIHLDGAFQFLGEHGVAHRRQIQATFDYIVTLARQDGYHLLLIAGDLFDGPHPTRRTVEHVKEQLGALAIPVCILPGNHDPLQPSSVYGRERFPHNVTVLRDQPTYLAFPEMELVVGGTPCTDSRGSALAELHRPPDCRWFVVMAHGNMEIAGFLDPDSRPIRGEELDRLQADYVALGDWHALADYSRPGVKAFYCGAPEPTTRSQEDTGHVLSVTLDSAGVSVEPIRVGRVKSQQVTLDITNLTPDEIRNQLKHIATRDTLLSVELTGLRAVDEYVDLADLVEALEPACYALHLVDRSSLMADDSTLADFPENQVIGQFMRYLSERIEQTTDPEQRRIREQALQLGVALLQGKKVLS